MVSENLMINDRNRFHLPWNVKNLGTLHSILGTGKTGVICG